MVKVHSTPLKGISVRRDKNAISLFDRSNGTKVRFAIGPYTKAKRPELVDIKITDFCPAMCPACYMGSTPSGEHSSMENMEKVIHELAKAKVQEVACLDRGTLVATPAGMVPIGDLVVGSEVYDSTGRVSVVTNVHHSMRDTIKLKGNRGFEVIATPDHPFIVSGNIVEAKDCVGRVLDSGSISPSTKTPPIDMSKYITPKNPTLRGSVGGSFGEDWVRMSSNSARGSRYVEPDNRLAWLYGIFLAEGSTRGVALGGHEEEYVNKWSRLYEDITGHSSTTRQPRPSSLVVEVHNPRYMRALFQDEMKIGAGSHNLTMDYLFNAPPEFIREAIIGYMNGDGCFRSKKNKKGSKTYTDFIMSFKTVSPNIAYSLPFLLKSVFNVDSTVYYGVSPSRTIDDGRVIPSTSYYMVDVYGKTNISRLINDPNRLLKEGKDLEEYTRIGTSIYSKSKVGSNKNAGVKILSIESSGEREVVDITLDGGSSHIFQLSHAVLSHNCGGGETTYHPQFADICKKFAQAGVVPNFTTKYPARVRMHWDNIKDYIGGFAYSAETPKNIYDAAKLLKRAGIPDHKVSLHHVMGLSRQGQFREYMQAAHDVGYRVTLLGYKTTGRGKNVTPFHYDWWIEEMNSLIREGRCPSTSIDTPLADQYDGLMPVESTMYHTREGAFSMYIDAVQMKMGASSFDESVDLVPFDKDWVARYKHL